MSPVRDGKTKACKHKTWIYWIWKRKPQRKAYLQVSSYDRDDISYDILEREFCVNSSLQTLPESLINYDVN